ncbi:MAG: hypothetical protein ACFFKA_10315 [Candidatus Thorarchaeota archaeon]
MQKMNPLSKERIEMRAANLEKGRELHEEHVARLQNSLVEELAPHEARLKEKMKAKKIDQEVINEYIEIWSELNFWPRPYNKSALRKQLRQLAKEHNIYG